MVKGGLLLIILDTVYGNIPETAPVYVCPANSLSFNKLVGPPYWRSNLYNKIAPDSLLYGSLTASNIPIPFYHQTLGPGYIGYTGMEMWQQCLTLFLRHI